MAIPDQYFSRIPFGYLFVISLGPQTRSCRLHHCINTWFHANPGVAMSINSAAFRLGGASWSPTFSRCLRWGWETAALWVGLEC
ncbi:MAG: hypothetical protein Ct9H300mP19_19700 [Dehalococcoidia bacterium]|nr:MAG: hypothetical protein Ct9H300mP19_19700 [Dehalococcoidia bacterium]